MHWPGVVPHVFELSAEPGVQHASADCGELVHAGPVSLGA